jgi:hypothetical protein
VAEPDRGRVCPLCGEEAPAPPRCLCRQCRAAQFRLLCAEAVGAGFFFVGLAILLYLIGRWYAG